MDKPDIIDITDAWAANVAKQEAALKANRNGADSVVYDAPAVQEAVESEPKPVAPKVTAPKV